MSDWRTHAHAAIVDLTAALITAGTDAAAIAHLADAQMSIERALDALEEPEPGEEGAA